MSSSSWLSSISLNIPEPKQYNGVKNFHCRCWVMNSNNDDGDDDDDDNNNNNNNNNNFILV